MPNPYSRRQFLIQAGISGAAANFMLNLPSLALGRPALGNQPKQRLVFIFSPNGVIPKHFWPSDAGTEFELKRIL